MTATQLQNKKITMATLKSFIKKADKLFVQELSSFDGMTDCVMPSQNKNFIEVSKDDAIGHKGVYCVGGSRDWLTFIESEKMYGIEVSNCCGNGILWTNK